MTAEIYNIRDYRRREEKLKEQAAEILKQVAVHHDTAPSEYVAPSKDPA